jgi:hypothetical protein
MMTVPLEGFLRWATESMGKPRVARMIRDTIQRRAASFGLSIDNFAKSNDIPPTRLKDMLTKLADSQDEDIRELTRCLRILKVPITADLRCPPWDRWEPGFEVVIIYGERQVRIPEVAKQMRQRAVGARDAEAMANLAALFQGRLQIDCKVRLYPVPSDLPRPEAEQKLGDLRKRPGVGGIVVLGSPVVNPLADPIARAMASNDPDKPSADPDDLPARFRWPFEPPPGTFLSEPRRFDAKDEGIHQRLHGSASGTTFPRTPDDEVLERLRNGDEGPFKDCGILMLDCRRSPVLLLLAGHGGCGTLACVEALEDQATIAARLDDSHDSGRSVVGPDRVFEVIEVDRRKREHSPMDLDDLEGSSPRFAWKDDAE